MSAAPAQTAILSIRLLLKQREKVGRIARARGISINDVFRLVVDDLPEPRDERKPAGAE